MQRSPNSAAERSTPHTCRLGSVPHDDPPAHGMRKTSSTSSSAKHVKLSIGGSVHDRRSRLATVVRRARDGRRVPESDLIPARTREGMQVAKAEGSTQGRAAQSLGSAAAPPDGSAQRRHRTTAELAELFNVAPSTVYRTIQRHSSHSAKGVALIDRLAVCARVLRRHWSRGKARSAPVHRLSGGAAAESASHALRAPDTR